MSNNKTNVNIQNPADTSKSSNNIPSENPAKIGVEDSEDVMSVSFSVGEKNIVFRMPNESYSKILIDEPQIYNRELEKFILFSRKLRGQVLFGNIDIEKLSEAYPFKPFAYQIENVLTMLNRFNGNGVFGDQVGLGKTVEALMTAHAMFDSGAIRNALIIVPKKLLGNWIKEIQSKFPGIFELHHEEYLDLHVREVLLKVIEDIKRTNSCASAKFHIYLLSDTMIASHGEEIMRFANEIEDYKNITKPLDASEEDQLNKLKSELMLLDPRDIAFDVGYPLKKMGWDADGIEDSEKLLGRLTIQKCEFIIKALNELKNSISRYRDDIQYNANSEINRVLSWFEDKLDAFHTAKNKYYLYKDLFEEGNNRIVDLLIVDEIHTFYEKTDSDGTPIRRNENEPGFSDDSSDTKNAVSFLAQIKRKFCVLISATPVRERLKDIFDLVFIADPNEFGCEYSKAYDYFFRTICQIEAKASNPLAKMVLDEKSFLGTGDCIEFNKTRFSNFLGLINNYFTRKRAAEIENDMKGTSDVLYKNMSESERSVIDALEERIIEKRTFMYLSSKNADFARESAELSFRAWKKYGTDANTSSSGNSLEESLNSRLHTRAAIDAVLMEEFESDGYTNEQKRLIHSMIDWRRRKKLGIAIKIDVRNGCARDEEIITSSSVIASELGEINDKLSKTVRKCRETSDSVCETREFSEIISRVSDTSIYPLQEKTSPALLHNHTRDIISNLTHEAAIYYVSRASAKDKDNNDNKKIREEIAKELSGADPKNPRPAIVCSNPQTDLPLDENSFNKIVILSQPFQAGLNLQQYRTLVFAQMDLKASELLEPVDIEQWIGRIHRTGQVKNCKIVTVLTTFMSNTENDPEKDFLRWYYDIIASPDGLDLYGDLTPDIAFLQPIITDCIREFLETVFNNAKMLKSYGSDFFKKIWKKTKLTKKNDIKNKSIEIILRGLPFSQAMEICYYYDKLSNSDMMHSFIVNLIKTLCTRPEFGKFAIKREDNNN